MKPTILHHIAITLIAALATACTDEIETSVEASGYRDVHFSVSLPQRLVTYASEKGGAVNLDAANYDLRYICEAWTSDGRLAYRGYQLVDDDFTATDVSFQMRLLAKTYTFAFWADFVPQNTAGTTYKTALEGADWETARSADFRYTTSDGKSEAELQTDATCDRGLTHVLLKADDGKYPDLNDETRDAFYALKSIDLTTQSGQATVTLERPFGKFRVVATALDPDGYLGAPTGAAFIYTGASTSLPAGFNAVSGAAIDTCTLPVKERYAYALPSATDVYLLDGTTYFPDSYVFALDYIFASEGSVVNFELNAYLASGDSIVRTFSNIPVSRNKLTTLVGDFYSGEHVLSLHIESEFEDESASSFFRIDNRIYTSLEQALDAAVGGDEVSLPKGAITVSGQITIPLDVTVRGDDDGSSVIVISEPVLLEGHMESLTLRSSSPHSAGQSWNGTTPVAVKMLEGGDLAYSTIEGFYVGVEIDHLDGFSCRDNTIQNCRIAIQLLNASSGDIYANNLLNNESCGISLEPDTEASMSGSLSIADNAFSGNWSADIIHRWTSAYVITVQNSTFSGGTKTLYTGTATEGDPGTDFSQGSITFTANMVTYTAGNIVCSGATTI
jgi:hypothetical protein